MPFLPLSGMHNNMELPFTPADIALMKTRGPSIIFRFPYLGIGLTPTTEDVAPYVGYNGFGGVYVRKVAPKGICNDAGIHGGDLLLAFDGHPLDRFGETQLRNGGLAERMNIYDLAERIEIGKNISFTVWRDHRSLTLYSKFAHSSHHDYAITDIFEPVLQRVGYVVIGGIVFMDLTINHLDFLLESNPSLVNYFKGQNRLQSRVVISGVLPESSIPENSLIHGDLVKTLNGKPISSLIDLQQQLDFLHTKLAQDTNKQSKHWLALETMEGSMVVLDLRKTHCRSGVAKTGSSGVGKAVNVAQPTQPTPTQPTPTQQSYAFSKSVNRYESF